MHETIITLQKQVRILRPPQLVVVHGNDSKVFSADFGKPHVSPLARTRHDR
jgi:hypothetical protein